MNGRFGSNSEVWVRSSDERTSPVRAVRSEKCQQWTHTCSNRRRGRQRRRPKHNPQIGRGRLSEAEPQPDRGSDVVALEKAEGQTAIHLREHDPGIEIPLRCKPPIDRGRDSVECAGALRMYRAGARGGSGGGAEEGILNIMIIGA